MTKLKSIRCPICWQTEGNHKMDCQNAAYGADLDDRIAELEAENQRLREAALELEMMIYLYVDGADIALEHKPILRRVIENCGE